MGPPLRGALNASRVWAHAPSPATSLPARPTGPGGTVFPRGRRARRDGVRGAGRALAERVRRSAPLVPVVTSDAERVELGGRPVTGELVETSRGAHGLVAIGPTGRRTVRFTVEYAD